MGLSVLWVLEGLGVYGFVFKRFKVFGLFSILVWLAGCLARWLSVLRSDTGELDAL